MLLLLADVLATAISTCPVVKTKLFFTSELHNFKYQYISKHVIMTMSFVKPAFNTCPSEIAIKICVTWPMSYSILSKESVTVLNKQQRSKLHT